MIKLKIDILSFYYLDKNFNKHFKEYNIVEDFDENITFGDLIKNLHNRYKINNGSFENYFIPYLTGLLWNQYFSEEICGQINDRDEDYYKLKLCELEKQFNISKLNIPLYLNYDGIGKAIGTIEGIKLYFHLDEKDLHHNPHIHCMYSGIETRIEIGTLKVLDKPFKKSKMDIAKQFIIDNREDLLNYWDKVVINGQSIELNIEI